MVPGGKRASSGSRDEDLTDDPAPESVPRTTVRVASWRSEGRELPHVPQKRWPSGTSPAHDGQRIMASACQKRPLIYSHPRAIGQGIEGSVGMHRSKG